ncbi:DUF1580 domain-containing protein [Pirellulales bacterium]|nr:DUF1580 domain-containing protein [Pirellulales bacterium]
MLSSASERLLTGPAAVEEITGDRPSYSTFFRWTTRGICSPGGQHVRLEYVKAGSRRLTSVEAVRRFFAASTAATNASVSTASKEIPCGDAGHDIESELSKEGL